MTIAVARAHDPLTTRVTWNAEIAPIINARCVSCHTVGGSAPMPLGTYDQARPWARAIKEAVLVRHMPNWRAARGYGDFLDDPSLSPFEIALVTAWADGGAPKGTGEVRSIRPLAPTAPQAERSVPVMCGNSALPVGRLRAIHPRLEKAQSVGIAVQFPDGRREIVAWIRDYDPQFPTTYWLRTPVPLPRGSRLITEGAATCAIDVTVTAR